MNTTEPPISKFKGLQSWEARASVGAPRLFESPELLRDAILEYFEFIRVNPLMEQKVGFSYGAAVTHETPRVRAMTNRGLALFIGITHKTLMEWKKTRPDLLPVIEWAEDVIWNQKFEAAGAGMLNANIISRELGLADKHIHAVNAPGMVIKPPEGVAPEAPPIHGEE
jgi:hypothetical protein